MAKRTASRRQTAHSNTYRFFVDGAAIRGDEVLIENGELAHQLSAVLRLDAGDQIVLLDNAGWQYTVVLNALTRGQIAGTVERKEVAAGEPSTKITLYVALMRPEKFEWVLQKGTELGVSAFVPLLSERSLIADASELSERKTERWAKIIREAAEQSRRGRLPYLAPAISFDHACEQAAQAGIALLLWEGEGVQPLRQVLNQARQSNTASAGSIAFLSGPEGGFADSELESARSYGIIPVTLGPRTLRAETAPLVAAAAIMYEMGDLD